MPTFLLSGNSPSPVRQHRRRLLVVRGILASGLLLSAVTTATAKAKFVLEEASIASIQKAILAHELTSVELVNRYLTRIKAYNGTAVKEPDGILGVIETIPHAGKINSLGTLNLRPAKLKEWGFPAKMARSLTDPVDADPALPDALEVAAAQDAYFAKTGKLIGPLHGVVMAIKDQYDTADLRTTAGADVPYANDRPPADATFVKRLRDHPREVSDG
jgi:hypothetical protein